MRFTCPCRGVNHLFGKAQRKCVRFPPGQIEKNVGNLGLLLGRRTCKGVGLVFPLSHGARNRVRCLVGNRINRRAANIVLVDRIGMDGDEQIRFMLAGDPHPFGKPQKSVVLARHENLDVLVLRQTISEFLPESERQVFFLDAAKAFRATVNSTVPGIDHDRERASRPILRRGPNRLFIAIGGTGYFLAACN